MPRASTQDKELERRRKIGETSAKRWQSDAYRQQVIIKLKKPRPNLIGRTPWNKGIPWSDSIKQKMREAAIKRGVIPESHSPEANAKRSQSLSKAFSLKWEEDTEYIEKNRRHLDNLNASESHKLSCRRGAKTLWEKHKDMVLDNLAKGRRKIATDPVIRAGKSVKVKQQWQRMKIEMIKAQRRGMKKPNKKESYLLEILEEFFPNEWQYVGNGAVVIECLVPDYIDINNKKLIIELFGDYWHGTNRARPYSSEAERSDIYKKYGYRMLVIWEHELKLSREEIAQKVRRFQGDNQGKD